MTIAKCPFCGEEDFVHAEDDECVKCGNCLAEGPFFDTLELSITSWNLASRSAEHLRIAVEALENICGKEHGCESFTTGIGSCFRNGRTIGAEYGADQVCDCCIAHAALARIKASDTATKGEQA